MRRTILFVSLLALSACGRAPSNGADAGDATVAAADNAATPAAGAVSIDVPGFKAKVDIPNLSVSGGGGDAIDGVPLYPGTQINGASVFAGDKGDGGGATIRYSASAAPGTVLGYYHDRAESAGYRILKQSADSLNARKPDGSGFTIVAGAGPNGGTEGSLTASGK